MILKVLKRLESNNIRVNDNKCEFFQDEIEYWCYKIDQHGIHKSKKKIDALEEMHVPKKKQEVKVYAGFENCYARFFENLSTVLYPINNLLKDRETFQWSRECQRAFIEVKRMMADEKFLVHFDPKLPLVLVTDALPYTV